MRDGLSRRGFLGGLTLTALVAGCGTATPSAAPAPAGADYPRTIATKLGAVTIPAQPRRVVTLGREAEVTLALGVTPVGMAKGTFVDGVEPFLADRVTGKDVTVLAIVDSVPFEQVAALRPDLILAGTAVGVEEIYPTLAALAPTVTFRTGSYLDTWQEQAAMIGEALGLEQQAAATTAALEARIADIAARHSGWKDRTFSLSFHHAAGSITTIVNPEDFAIKLVQQLGLVLAPNVAALPAPPGQQPSLSYELVGSLDTDVLLLAHVDPDVQTLLERNPVFGTVPAVRDGRYVPVDLTTVAAMRTPMVLGIEYVLDQLVPQLEEALGS